MRIKAKIYCNGLYYNANDIDISPITNADIVNYSISENGVDYLNIFQEQHYVNDVWRYTIKICCGNIQLLPIIKTTTSSDFSDRPATDAIGSKIILLILESPHISEYDKDPTSYNDLKPKAPAQGKSPADAGGGIERYLHIVLRKINLTDGYYSLVISNPIPYMCSLRIVTKKMNTKVRDNVWKAILEIKNEKNNYVIQEEFMARYAMYQPICTINCCTEPSTNLVTDLLLKHNLSNNLYKTTHPSVTWNVQQYNIKVDKI